MKSFMEFTQKMKKFFITGTDTGVGKTLTSAVLTFALKAHYWKPIQSGVADETADYEKIQQLTGLADTYFFPSAYVLKASLAPGQAAHLENIFIDIKKINLPEISSSLIVEGAGGIFVPLNQTNLVLDLIKKINFPVIIVSRGTIGTINHTLLTIEALRQRKIMIEGIIFSGDLNPSNQLAIEQWGNVKTILHIPKFENLTPVSFQTWVKQHQQKILSGLL